MFYFTAWDAYIGLGLCDDRRHVVNIAQRCSAIDVLMLLEACIGKAYQSPCLPDAVPLGVLGQARSKCLEDLATTQYLLLQSDKHYRSTKSTLLSRPEGIKITLNGPKKHTLMAKVLDFLVAEISTLLDALKNSLKPTPDIATVTTTLCVVSYSILADQSAKKNRRYDELRKETRSLLEALMISISKGDGGLTVAHGFLDSFATVSPSLTELLMQKTLLSQGLVDLLRDVDSNWWFDILSSETNSNLAREENEEQVDSEFESQISGVRPKQNGTETSYSTIATVSFMRTFRSSLAAKLFFVSSTQTLPNEPPLRPIVTEQFTNLMVSLPPSLFICCRHFLKDLFGPDISLGVDEATSFLRYIGQELLQSYKFERSETAMGVSLDILTGLVSLWTNADNTVVSEEATDIYDWFIKVTLERQLASSQVLVCMSILLQRLIRTSPDYGKSLGLPSARTSLFKVLENGDLDVKFSVGNNISEIFGLFVLKQHENILEDVIEILPKEADWLDGIALRLYILCRLAQSWPTLLRRCVYAIYETAGAVPSSTAHAGWCLAEVSKSLQLQDSRELLRLFAPQILYTWLEMQTLTSMPYSVFGYQSLKNLLIDVQEEVTGQIVMRHKDDEGLQLTKQIGKSFGQVVEESIGKAAGYAIAQDVAVPPIKNSQVPGAEAALRKTIGKEKYAALVRARFHEVLLTFFKSMDEDKGIEKTFGSHPYYQEAQTNYREMKSISASTEVLPVGQQPLYKARYFVDEVNCICRRTGQRPESIWSPSLYVYIFRGLLDTLHPALGSQHACSTIRRLRVLVSIAGKSALKSYPLEMALHSLRPFLTDIHCSEDSVGIIQHLLMAGKPYLKTVPTFLTGLGVVSLISLKSFLGSSQESTTQESQYQATMTRASSFHQWLGAYLSDYTSDDLPANSASSFKRITEAARNVRANGNAHRGSHESDLLMEILDDIISGRELLNEPSRELILHQLCADFERPTSFREDILGLDSEAALFAPILWKLIKDYNFGEKFVLWVGSVLGRAYASTGEANKRMTLETNTDYHRSRSGENNTEGPISSQSCVLKVFNTMLLLDNRRQVGVVEKTLRSIISQAERTDLLVDCEQNLPPSVITGLLWRDYHVPTLHPDMIPQRDVEEVVASFKNLKAQEWVQQLCIALAARAKDDLLLSALPYLLSNIDGVYDRLFPFIVHLTLSREFNGQQTIRSSLSTACRSLFEEQEVDCRAHTRFLLKTLLYLRTQPLPQEVTKSDRSHWLDIDYNLAASAAVRCSMFKTALLFLDIGFSEAAKASRRVSTLKVEVPTDLLLQVYKNIDEQDAFYGVEQPSSLASMMARLEYEHAGFKSLSFRGAHYDSQIRFSPSTMQTDEEGMVQALEVLDLNGLSQSLLGKMTNLGLTSLKTMLNTARKLEQWDLSAPVTHAGTASTLFRAFQGIHNAQQSEAFRDVVDVALKETMLLLNSGETVNSSFYGTLSTLAILTEMDELCSVRDHEQLEDVWLRFEEREEWMHTER